MCGYTLWAAKPLLTVHNRHYVWFLSAISHHVPITAVAIAKRTMSLSKFKKIPL